MPRPMRRGRGLPANHAQDGIIRWPQDGAIMVQERVSYRSEAALRFGIVSDDRFAADIAGCGHQRAAEFRQQKMMQRTVGQEHAQLCKVWRYRRAERTICVSARQHDWARGIQSSSALLLRSGSRNRAPRRGHQPPFVDT